MKDPTDPDLSGTFPFGGDEMGVTAEANFVFEENVAYVTAEEFGGQKVQSGYVGEGAVAGAILRSWDKDMLSAVHPNTVASSRLIRMRQTVSGSGSRRAGTFIDTIKLLFVPEDRQNHPFVVLYAAAPEFERAAKLRLANRKEMGLAILFVGQPDSLGRIYDSGQRSEITL